MFRRRRGQRQPQSGPALPREARGWSRRVVLWGLAIGLVVMHHLVGGHQHGPAATVGATSDTSAAASSPAARSAASAPVGGAGAALGSHHAGGTHVQAALPRGPVQHHPDGDGPDAMTVVLHMCLAVLAAALLLLVAFAVLASRWRTHRQRPLQVEVGSVAARPPPVSMRLAQLQVLRL